jgi:hypothetical protein
MKCPAIYNPASCEIRAVIRFLQNTKSSAEEIHRELCAVYGQNIMSEETARRWCRMFKDWRANKCSRWRAQWSAFSRERWSFSKCKSKGEGIPVTGRGGPQVCETSRLPRFLDNQITDGGEIVSLTRRLAAHYLQEGFWYTFLLEAESTQGS